MKTLLALLALLLLAVPSASAQLAAEAPCTPVFTRQIQIILKANRDSLGAATQYTIQRGQEIYADTTKTGNTQTGTVDCDTNWYDGLGTILLGLGYATTRQRGIQMVDSLFRASEENIPSQ